MFGLVGYSLNTTLLERFEMSYPRDLDEIPESELLTELLRRQSAQAEGICDYCGRKCNAEPPCKFPERHRGKMSEAEELAT